jgi:hypothetical protein
LFDFKVSIDEEKEEAIDLFFDAAVTFIERSAVPTQ